MGNAELFPNSSFSPRSTKDYEDHAALSAFHVCTLKDNCDPTARWAMQLQVAPPGGTFKVLCVVRCRVGKFTNHERTKQRTLKNVSDGKRAV